MRGLTGSCTVRRTWTVPATRVHLSVLSAGTAAGRSANASAGLEAACLCAMATGHRHRSQSPNRRHRASQGGGRPRCVTRRPCRDQAMNARRMMQAIDAPSRMTSAVSCAALAMSGVTIGSARSHNRVRARSLSLRERASRNRDRAGGGPTQEFSVTSCHSRHCRQNYLPRREVSGGRLPPLRSSVSSWHQLRQRSRPRR